MPTTNIHDIDPIIAEAVTRDDYYDKPDCDATVTQLLKPSQIQYLEMIHQHEIVRDVGDGLFMLLGSAVHEIMSRYAPAESIAEERFHADIGGWDIAGKPDLWRPHVEGIEAYGVLSDFKVTSVWSFLLERANGYVKPDWERQFNCYAWFFEMTGFPVGAIRVTAILRDWISRRGREAAAALAAGKEDDYPVVPFLSVPVNQWAESRRLSFLHERCKVARYARRGRYEPCTAEERWNRGDGYAVYQWKPEEYYVKGPKKGQLKKGTGEWAKRALRVFDPAHGDTEPLTAALELIAELAAKGIKAKEEPRPGISIRCKDWCEVAPWCAQCAQVEKDERWADLDKAEEERAAA